MLTVTAVKDVWYIQKLIGTPLLKLQNYIKTLENSEKISQKIFKLTVKKR